DQHDYQRRDHNTLPQLGRCVLARIGKCQRCYPCSGGQHDACSDLVSTHAPPPGTLPEDLSMHRSRLVERRTSNQGAFTLHTTRLCHTLHNEFALSPVRCARIVNRPGSGGERMFMSTNDAAGMRPATAEELASRPVRFAIVGTGGMGGTHA